MREMDRQTDSGQSKHPGTSVHPVATTLIKASSLDYSLSLLPGVSALTLAQHTSVQPTFHFTSRKTFPMPIWSTHYPVLNSLMASQCLEEGKVCFTRSLWVPASPLFSGLVLGHPGHCLPSVSLLLFLPCECQNACSLCPPLLILQVSG